jgi:dTDP-4-amino-4,6-dideoxygalactose transaminase
MNEVQAAFGLLQLKYLAEGEQRRKRVDLRYRNELQGIPGITLPPQLAETEPNYSYFPILISPPYSLTRDELYTCLREHGVFARRYFYPLISDMPMYRGLPSSAPEHLPVATRISQQVLCLPIHADLAEEEQGRVIQIIKG